MRTVAVVQAKGGVGKSTVAVHLACGLADSGHETILVDLDPACGASRYLGVASRSGRPDLWDVLEGKAELIRAAIPVPEVPRLRVVPSRATGYELVIRGPFRLRVALAPLPRKGIAFVVLDTPSTWSPSTAKALTAAQDALVVAEPKSLSLAALVEQLRLIEQTRRHLNPDLELLGIVPNRVVQTRLARRSLARLEEQFPGRILPAIRESTRIAEAPEHHKPVTRYAPTCPGARDFRTLTEAIIGKLGAGEAAGGGGEGA